MTSGSLCILNVGLGDIEFRFDTGDPAEVEKAKRAIEDMLRRGYTILVDDGSGQLRRATGFDPARGVYIIDKVPGEAGPRGPDDRGHCHRHRADGGGLSGHAHARRTGGE